MPNVSSIADTVTYQGFGASNPFPVQLTTPGMTGAPATQVVASSGNVAAATATATLAASATKTTYITGFEVTGLGATAGLGPVLTITGLLGGTISYVVGVPAGVTVPLTPLIVQFPQPLAGSAINTAIVVSVPTFGSGNTAACVTAHGFQQ